MRPAGGGRHETLRLVEIEAMPMARPQGRQSLNVSRSHLVSMSRCLNVSASLLSQVSGLPSPASLALAVQGVACEDRDVEARGRGAFYLDDNWHVFLKVATCHPNQNMIQ